MRKKSTLREWSPKFAGGYEPGDASMGKPSGNGVASRSLKKEKVGQYDTDMSDMNRKVGSKHKETEAMCDVDEDGVENEPEFGHASTHGEPDDGHQTPVGHNWPDGPKNSGGSMEPLAGERYNNGGVLKPSSVDEEWSPASIGALLNDSSASLQRLFDAYANNSEFVCLEGFQSLLDSYGNDSIIDESVLINLIENNKTHVFDEHFDSDGVYWVGKSAKNMSKQQLNEFTMGDLKSMFSDALGMDNVADDTLVQDNEVYDDDIPGAGMSDDVEMVDDEMVDDGMVDDEMVDDGMTDDGMISDEMVDAEDTVVSSDGVDDGMVDDEGAVDDDIIDARTPEVFESLRRFVNSSSSIMSESRNRNAISSALNASWDNHVGRIYSNVIPTSIRGKINKLQRSFPGFEPTIFSEDATTTADVGVGILAGGNPKLSDSEDLKNVDDFDGLEEKGKLMGHKIKNSSDGDPVIKGTGKGMSESAVVASRNIVKLASHIKKALNEAKISKTLTGVKFSILVKESNGKTNRTIVRKAISEAIADVEEILQVHKPSNVSFEIHAGQKNVSVPMISVNKRKPIFSEGKAIFRFNRMAEAYADKLVGSGKSCVVESCNWGSSVKTLKRKQ